MTKRVVFSGQPLLSLLHCVTSCGGTVGPHLPHFRTYPTINQSFTFTQSCRRGRNSQRKWFLSELLTPLDSKYTNRSFNVPQCCSAQEELCRTWVVRLHHRGLHQGIIRVVYAVLQKNRLTPLMISSYNPRRCVCCFWFVLRVVFPQLVSSR